MFVQLRRSFHAKVRLYIILRGSPNSPNQLFIRIADRTVRKLKNLIVSLKNIGLRLDFPRDTRGWNFLFFMSPNCIGGRFYELMESRYLFPTVGLWFELNDFLLF